MYGRSQPPTYVLLPFKYNVGIVVLSLVPGVEEECLVHTDALPVNLKCRCLCLGVCSEKIVNILMWPS